jgi:ribosome biogenesis GTPase
VVTILGDPDLVEPFGIVDAGVHERERALRLLDEVRQEKAQERIFIERARQCANDGGTIGATHPVNGKLTGTHEREAYAVAVLKALSAVGWNDEVARRFAGRETPARVTRIDRGRATVATAAGPAFADLGGHTVATGDWVLLANDTIMEVLPRHSAFVRGDTIEGVARDAQVVAANIDVVFVVHALAAELNVRRLERELVLAFESGAQPVVVLTKADLASDADIEQAVADAHATARDLDVLVTSARTGRGIDALRTYARPNRTVALIGASGAGKSTLVNEMVGREEQAIGEVRASDQRGRHTTTSRDLVLIPGGGVLIDTPGLRSVALWGSEDGFSRVFSDIEELARQCRFHDCGHGAEPDCAVQAAIARGDIDPARLDHYRKLDAELTE